MLLRTSKAGTFWGCRGYPKCRGTRKTKRHLVGQRVTHAEPFA
ncbi:MAG: topoisomerase DNA-binding C4 zinc finger domain-containing protein [Chthoniobacteraceae bacterium]